MERWCRRGEQRPHHDPARVNVGRDGRGYVQLGHAANEYLVLRRFIERQVVSAVPAASPDRLAARLNLPGLGALDAPHWVPFDKSAPAALLAQVAALAAQPSGQRATPAVSVELVPVTPLTREEREAEMAEGDHGNKFFERGAAAGRMLNRSAGAA